MTSYSVLLSGPRATVIATWPGEWSDHSAKVTTLTDSGQDPDSTSRAWQTCEVTRSLRNGQAGPLPEGAAAWLVRSWGPDHSPAERWAARDRLVRIEQLVAACRAHGGRAESEDDPLLAHLVVPHGGDMADDEVA